MIHRPFTIVSLVLSALLANSTLSANSVSLNQPTKLQPFAPTTVGTLSSTVAGTFSTGVDGVSINSTTNEVTIDPFAFKPAGAPFIGPTLLEDNGKPHIAVTFTKT
ncbi:MAG: hypothetical protein AAGJ79_01170, partial [Verrucomicrobiota bacterium]